MELDRRVNLNEISTPIQLHHTEKDSSVPIQFSKTLAAELKAAGKDSQFFTYPGDDHNIAKSFGLAMGRTVAFFNKYLK